MPWWSELVIDDAYWTQFGPTLTIKELAQITRRSEQTVWRWLLNGKLPGHGIGTAWIVYTELVRRQLEDPEDTQATPVEFLAQFPEELSADDVEVLLGKKRATIRKWLADGSLPGHRLGGAWLMYKTEYVQLLEQTYKQPPRILPR